MKYSNWIRIAQSMLVLLAAQVLLSSNHVRTAHGQSTLRELEATKWKGFVDIGKINEFDFVLIDSTYVFAKDGAVKVAVVYHVSGYELRQQYNSISGKTDSGLMFNPSKSSHSENLECTYKQTGTSIRIKCNSWDIDATIRDNRMDGEVQFRTIGKRARWIIEESADVPSVKSSEGVDYFAILNESNSVPAKGDAAYPNVVHDSNGKFQPASGYQWINPIDPKDFRVTLMLGLKTTEDGRLLPAKGYRWVNPRDPKDFRVEQIP